MRCFVGVELPEHVAALCKAAREAIVDFDPAWRHEKWVAAENLHVTLAFLGEVDEGQLTRLVDGLRDLRVNPFWLLEPELVPVPSRRRASMCWLEFRDQEGSAGMLAAQISHIAEESGIELDSSPRRFRPHVTLVRTRRGRSLSAQALDSGKERVGASADTSMSVSSVTVFTSTLTTAGPVYTRVATIALIAS